MSAARRWRQLYSPSGWAAAALFWSSKRQRVCWTRWPLDISFVFAAPAMRVIAPRRNPGPPRPAAATRQTSSFELRAPNAQVDGRSTIHHIRTHGKVSRRRPRPGLAALGPRLPQHLALLPLLHRRVRACCPPPPPPPAASRLTAPV